MAITEAQNAKGQQNEGRGLAAGPACLPVTDTNDGVSSDPLEDS